MALEACISLTLFLIAMMALYSLINMFTAQSMISHALAADRAEHCTGKL